MLKKSVFYRINNFIKFHKRKFVECNSIELYFNEQQECKTGPQVINVNGGEPVFFPFSIKTSKCSGSYNNINYPYEKICVPDIVKKNEYLI